MTQITVRERTDHQAKQLHDLKKKKAEKVIEKAEEKEASLKAIKPWIQSQLSTISTKIVRVKVNLSLLKLVIIYNKLLELT